MSYIQLPDGLKQNVSKIQLNIPKDEKEKDLLEHLPYLANLKDPVFQNKVDNLLKNREDLQSYLLATEDLNRTIEDSLQLAVTHRKLNDESTVRHVSERDDPKYNFFRKNDNPLDVVYREQAKFDVQNPVIGSLLKQINRGRLTDENTKKTLDKGPDPRYLDLEDKYKKIFEKTDDFRDKGFPPDIPDGSEDDDFSPSESPPPPPPPQSPPLGYVPRPGAPDDQFVGDRPGREYFFPYAARTGRADPDFRPPIVLDGNLQKVFPHADEALYDDIEIKESDEYADFSDKLDRGEIREELQFFSGGSEKIALLYREINDYNLNARNQDFLDYLATDECKEALERDGISIHVSSGDIYVNNENTGESLYTFLDNQQDETKKEIPLDFTYDDDYTDYMTKYLPAINKFDEVKHDF